MMKKLHICISLCLLTLPVLTFAAASTSSLPSNNFSTGFFAGLGGGYNSVNLEQNVFASGVSNVYTGGVLAAFGQAGGPATPYNTTQSTFVPALQAGYVRDIPNTNLLWGIKFSYKYLGTTITTQPVNIPQGGAFTNANGTTDTLVGHVAIESLQTSVSHELALMPFIGRAFNNSYVYAGAGPELFKVEANLNNGTGYADVNGSHSDLTGAADSFSDSRWVAGGGAQVGVDYFFDPTWFVDVNYSYAMSQHYTVNDSAPFTSSFIANGSNYVSTGTLYVNNSLRVISQGITLSINKSFG